MTVWGLGVVLRLGFWSKDNGFAKSGPGRAGRHGRHGGGAPAKCGRPLMSALILSPFDFVESLISYQEERASS